MDSARLPITETRNIPHMQLFHHLKQKFPDLKDNDVNESIQKYGLDRERCEEELSQKNLIHHGGYYGPWGRPGSGLSSPSLSRVTSPIRTGVPSTPTTPVITTTTATTSVLHHTTATHHIFGPLQSSGYLAYSYGPGPGPLYTSPNTTTIATSPASYQPPINSPTGYGWHPSVTNGFRAAGIYPPPRHHTHGGYSGPDTPFSSRETSKSRSTTPNLPNSAPVIPNSYDPFNNYEQLRDPPERRKSAETNYDLRRGLYYNTQNLEHYLGGTNEYQYHSPTPPLNCNLDSPATPSTTTTTTITTTSSNCIDPSNVSSSSTVNRPPPALVQEQSARKRKLEAELVKQMDEKGKLQNEVEMMARELEAREHQRKGNADTNTKRIEDVQRENQRLQSECYEMENQILRIAPDMEQEEYPSVPPNVPYTEVSPTPQLPLPSSKYSRAVQIFRNILASKAKHKKTEEDDVYEEDEDKRLHIIYEDGNMEIVVEDWDRASSGSSMGSGGGTPQTPHTPYMPYTSQSPGVFIPPRPTMPPPPPPPPTSLPNHTYREFQNAPPGPVDEAGRMWGCTKCTFINHPDMNKCEMCDYPCFTIGTTPSHHAALPPNHQGPCYCHRHHITPGVVAGSIGATAAYSPHHSYSSLPLTTDKPSLTNILKEKLLGLRDRSDSV